MLLPLVMTGRVAWVKSDVVTVIPAIAAVSGQLLPLAHPLTVLPLTVHPLAVLPLLLFEAHQAGYPTPEGQAASQSLSQGSPI
jgi:hypothetical protein